MEIVEISLGSVELRHLYTTQVVSLVVNLGSMCCRVSVLVTALHANLISKTHFTLRVRLEVRNNLVVVKLLNDFWAVI